MERWSRNSRRLLKETCGEALVQALRLSSAPWRSLPVVLGPMRRCQLDGIMWQYICKFLVVAGLVDVDMVIV